MGAYFLTKSPQQKLSDIGPKGSKKVKNCTKLVHFFTRDGRLRSKWTLFTLFRHYFKNTHSRHCVPLSIMFIILSYLLHIIRLLILAAVCTCCFMSGREDKRQRSMLNYFGVQAEAGVVLPVVSTPDPQPIVELQPNAVLHVIKRFATTSSRRINFII